MRIPVPDHHSYGCLEPRSYFFTDVVLGTLQDIQLRLAQNNADEGPAVVPIIGSVIGNEGEQTGFFRNISPILCLFHLRTNTT